MAVRIPQIDPALLARWAEAKGMATAAPFQAIGGAMSKIQEAHQKYQLKQEQTKLKLQENERKYAEDIVGNLPPELKQYIVTSMAKANQMPSSQNIMQALQGMDLSKLPATTTAKSGDTTLTKENINIIEAQGGIPKGAFKEGDTIKTSDYIDLLNPKKSQEVRIPINQELKQDLANSGVSQSLLKSVEGKNITLSQFQSLKSNAIKRNVEQARLEINRQKAQGKIKPPIAQQAITLRSRIQTILNTTKDALGRINVDKLDENGKRELNDLNKKLNKILGLDIINLDVPKAKSEKQVTTKKEVTAKTPPAGFVKAVDAQGNEAWVKKDKNGKIIEIREIK